VDADTHTGVAVNNKNCDLYGNFFPWSSNAHAANTLRTVPQSSNRLLIRYEAKNRDVNTGGAYDMVQDTGVSRGQGNWGFIQSGCLTNVPPPSYQS
jgi:hypothetical protein